MNVMELTTTLATNMTETRKKIKVSKTIFHHIQVADFFTLSFNLLKLYIAYVLFSHSI